METENACKRKTTLFSTKKYILFIKQHKYMRSLGMITSSQEVYGRKWIQFILKCIAWKYEGTIEFFQVFGFPNDLQKPTNKERST